VEGLSELALEADFRLNPDDLAKLTNETGDAVTIAVNGAVITVGAKADENCPVGVIYFHRPVSFGGLAGRKNLEPLYRLNTNPIKVSARSAVGAIDEKKKSSKKLAKRNNPKK